MGGSESVGVNSGVSGSAERMSVGVVVGTWVDGVGDEW